MTRKAKANPYLNEGPFTVAIPPTPRRFGLFKGDVLLGMILDHPCGKWCFVPEPDCPPLILETIGVIAKSLMKAEELYMATLEHQALGKKPEAAPLFTQEQP